jgi:hypothetical protein
MLLEDLLDLRRVLFLNEKLLQVIIVHLHLGVLATCVKTTAILSKGGAHWCGLQLAATRRACQRGWVLGQAVGLLDVVLLNLLDLFLG